MDELGEETRRHKAALGLAALGDLCLTAAFAIYLHVPYLILNPPPDPYSSPGCSGCRA